MHNKPERVYRYPRFLEHVYICGFIMGGIVALGGGAYATIYSLLMMAREGESSMSLRAIGVGLFLVYNGINFLYLATNRFPIEIALGEDGIQLRLFRNRRVIIPWRDIEVMRNYGVIFKFRRSESGLSRWLVLKDYVVFPFMTDYWNFVSQFRMWYGTM